jgi:hypothetical protein
MKTAVLILVLTTVWAELASAQLVVTDPGATASLARLVIQMDTMLRETTGQTVPAGVALQAKIGGSVTVSQTPNVPLGTTTIPTDKAGYNGSKLLSLGGSGNSGTGITGILGGSSLYAKLPVSTPATGWSDKYNPYVYLEAMTDKTVDTFNQTDQNVQKLRGQLNTAVTALNSATNLAQIEVIQAKIAAIHAEISRQEYIRDAAMQQVQLVALANENNRKKRELADLESKSEEHANSLGVNPTSISGAVQAATLLGFMSDLRTSATGPGSLEN